MEKGPQASGGFTIVETLIVLAVTGLLLASALVVVSGRDAKVRFRLEVTNIQGQIEQIINETQEGYYRNGDSFKCSADDATAITQGYVHIDDSSGGQAKGTNGGCTFLGKIFQFEGSSYEVHPLAGFQFDPTTKSPVTTLAQAKPTVVVAGDSIVTVSIPSYVQIDPATDINANDTKPVESFGFMYGNDQGVIANTDVASGHISSGSQQFSLYALSVNDPSPTATLVPISGYTPPPVGSPVPWARHVDSVTVCVRGGSGDVHSALIKITDVGGLGVTTQFKSSSNCL